MTRIFQALQGNYGSRFTNMWRSGQLLPDGQDTGLLNAMNTWAEKLGGFHDQPERIRAVLDALPPEPPTLPQFVELCRHAPGKTVPAIEHKITEEERERGRQIAEKVAKAVKRESTDHLAWARRPGSQKAMDAIFDGFKNAMRYPQLARVFGELLEQGVCTEDGKLIKRWDVHGAGWVNA